MTVSVKLNLTRRKGRALQGSPQATCRGAYDDT